MTEIFDETLDPPTIAAKGLLGTSTAPRRYRYRNRYGERRVSGGGREERIGKKRRVRRTVEWREGEQGRKEKGEGKQGITTW